MKNHGQNDVFFAISDPTRRSIIDVLTNGSMALKSISSHFPMTRTAVSKHLKILQDADLVESKKLGRETIYQISPQALVEVHEWIKTYSEFWDEKLKDLKYFVENSDE